MVVNIKGKNYKINMCQFISRIMLCTFIIMILVMLIITSIDKRCDNTIKPVERLNVETVSNDTLVNNIESITQICTLENLNSSNTIESTIDYSIKPDALDNIYFEWIVEISKKEDVPLEVILAIITTENETYNADAININSNGTRDIGMCQINSAYVDYFAKTYNIDNFDPYNVYDSITFVARHMKYLSEYATNNYALYGLDSYIFAAGAYNRGLGDECEYRNMYHYKEKFLNNYNKFI